MIFREAKKCNVVLFFDECDTIFAKRSDDGGSNQASANNKTALLLQEMEAYDGVCVLATNYKHNIDPAFFRRMKYIVEFQFPDPDTREMLWRTTIPKDTPLAEDVDIRFLAERFEFAGGNIKNCILNAGVTASEMQRSIAISCKSIQNFRSVLKLPSSILEKTSIGLVLVNKTIRAEQTKSAMIIAANLITSDFQRGIASRLVI